MAKGSFIPYTEAQEQFIRDNFLTMPVKKIASATGSSHGRIMRFLKKHNLEIPQEIIQQRVADSRRKKGDVSWNKGKKQTDYMSTEAIERTKNTRFKKGNLPHNTHKQGNGAIVSRKDNSGRIYKYIRVQLGVWELYHRFIWEQAYGKIPENHVVVFKDDDTMNTCLENLELITCAENMLRNSKHNIPREVIPSILLHNQLKTKLKNLENG